MELRAIPDGQESPTEALERLIARLGERPTNGDGGKVVKMIVTDESSDSEEVRTILYLCSPQGADGKEVHSRERLNIIMQMAENRTVVLRLTGYAVRAGPPPTVGMTSQSISGFAHLHRHLQESDSSSPPDDLTSMMHAVRDHLEQAIHISGYDVSVFTMPFYNQTPVRNTTTSATSLN